MDLDVQIKTNADTFEITSRQANSIFKKKMCVCACVFVIQYIACTASSHWSGDQSNSLNQSYKGVLHILCS